MELKDFISETIIQIASGIIDAKKMCEEQGLDIIINPDQTFGKNGNYFLLKKGKSDLERRVQNIDMDVSVTISESEDKGVNGKADIKILGIGANTTESKGTTNENRIRFTIPVCLPTTKVETNK